MSEVLRFLSRNCPPGSLVHHPELGVVQVIRAQGFEREIKCDTFDGDFHPQTIYEWVHVSRLRAVDYARDFGLIEQSLIPHQCKIIPFSQCQDSWLDDDS